MGQNVTVIEKPSSNPEIVRFEINRSLTGMGHERYGSLDDIVFDRAVDRLARSLFEAGGVDDVHINSSVITVRLAGGSTGHGLGDIIRNMFRFYGDDPEDGAALEADASDIEAAEAGADGAGADGADAAAVDAAEAGASDPEA